MPPDLNSPLTPHGSVRSRKIAWMFGGVACVILLAVVVATVVNKNSKSEQQVSEEELPTPMVSGLTPEQIKLRDEMQARLDELAKEEGGNIEVSPEEMQARLDSLSQEGTTTPVNAEEMQARLDALNSELVN